MVSPDGFFPERNCVQKQHASAVILHRFGSTHPDGFNTDASTDKAKAVKNHRTRKKDMP
jgi:hypothetical protein